MSTLSEKAQPFLRHQPRSMCSSPHTTYYTNFFVLRMAVIINGQAAEISFSSDKELTLNCRYPSTECVSITFHTISSQVETVLKTYGVSRVSNFWFGEVPYFQVSFSSELNLVTFLCARQEMQREVGLLVFARLREGQPSIASASSVNHGSPVEVETDLFLVLPDAEDKMRAVSKDNSIACLTLCEESKKFDFGTLFRTFKQKTAGGATVKGELSVNVLVSELSDVVDWFTFGLYLGVPIPDLLKIERDHQYTTDRLIRMLDWWVKNGEQLTWSAVVRALFGIRMGGLAKKITVKYAVPCTATDTHPTHITEAGSQTTPGQLPANIQQMYSSLEEQDKELTRISESLPAAKKRKMAASEKHTEVKKQLTVAKSSKETLATETDATRRQLDVEDGELRFLKRLRKIEKKNDELQAIISKKEKKIAQLKEQQTGKESELTEAREEVQKLTKQLQQTTMELADQLAAQVRDMERARADIERERNRADMMVIQLCAMSQGVRIQLERVTPAQLETLKRAVKEKEEEVRRLSSCLEAKEAERQKLLERQQSQQVEDQLVEVICGLSELQTSLMEAEDGRTRAEVELEDLKSKKSVINPQPSCKAVGRGLQFGETNQIAQFKVHLTDANGEPCVERQEVRAELKSLVDGSIAQADVSHQTRSVGSYEVSYQPSIRGRHKLSVSVNGEVIAGSPFTVYVQQPPQLMGQPVKVINGLSGPRKATVSSSGQLIVTDLGRIAIFDGQGEVVRRINSVGRQHSRVQLNPRGVAVDGNGALYFCEENAHKVLKVNSTGKFLKSVGGKGSGSGQFYWPDGITVRDNKIFVCDRGNHRIQIFCCDLNFISSFGSHGRGEGEFNIPRDLAFDQEGKLYVVEEGNHRVQVFSPSGTFLRIIDQFGSGSGELRGPYGIYVEHNIVYIAEYYNNCISTFTTLGEFITSFGTRGRGEGEFSGPCGITMNCDGFLYVCEFGNDRIQIF